MKTNLILINNDIVDAEEINVHPFNRGHQFGDGVYEIVPVYNGKGPACGNAYGKPAECAGAD